MVRIANNILKAKREEVVQAQRLDKSSSRYDQTLHVRHTGSSGEH